MNNEPVAWTQNTFCKYCHRIPSQCGCTHPVKELTDEEINTEMLAYLNSKTMGLEEFARSILKKAQEK